MAKKPSFEDINVRNAIFGAYHVVTKADIATLRDLCLKPPGKSRTETKIMKIVREINRVNSEAAQLRALLDSNPSPARAVKLLRMQEDMHAEEMARCTRKCCIVFGPRAIACHALAYELERLAAAAQPIQPSTRVVVEVAALYSKNRAENLEILCDSYHAAENEAELGRQEAEYAQAVCSSPRDQDGDAHRRAIACLSVAEETARGRLSALEARALDTGYELMSFDNQLIKLLLNSDQPTRREIGKLLFPEDFKETE